MTPSHFNRWAEFQPRDSDHDLSLVLPSWKLLFLKRLLQLVAIAFICTYFILCFR